MSLIVSNESKVRAASRMSETDLTGQSGPADSHFISALRAGVLYDCISVSKYMLVLGSLLEVDLSVRYQL